MSLKDNWKDAGKNIGKSFAGLGKSIVKSVKTGADAILDDTPTEEEANERRAAMKETWSEVGHSFGDAGVSLGKAAAKTAQTVADKIDDDDAPNAE